VTYKEEYTASISIWAMKNIGTDSTVQTTDLSMATYMVNDYREQLKSDTVVSKVQKAHTNFGSMSISSLKNKVQISHVEETRILKLSATASTAEGAKLLADTWGTTFCTYINEEKFGETMVTFDEALEPTAPSNGISLVKVLLMGILGAILVYAIFFVRFLLDDKINTSEDVERYLDLTVLGAIPNKNTVLPKKDSHYRYHKSSGYYQKHNRGKK
jgi:capsular polysaccharide biosynthesis protein